MDTPVAVSSVHPGCGIKQAALRLRNLAFTERRAIKLLAGWFLAHPAYEVKYQLAYTLYDAAAHVTALRARLTEMRGGNAGASVRPELAAFLEEALNAPTAEDFVGGFYGVIVHALHEACTQDLQQFDPSANANEVRLLRHLVADYQRALDWYQARAMPWERGSWPDCLRTRLASIGGIHGDAEAVAAVLKPPDARPFERPATIVFDERIQKGRLSPYEERQGMAPDEATAEQFKVFFNEFYAAALLASILYDAADGDYPWEFFADFSRHFWDEARHSEFGAIRLKELGREPGQVDPSLFEQSQDLPVLHRVAYLTRGLEAYFMPRKPKRYKEYEKNGDTRSQLFADQDWSDEINHVRYGSRWTEQLLKEDFREVDDVLEEVKEHLGRVRGETVADISAPF